MENNNQNNTELLMRLLRMAKAKNTRRINKDELAQLDEAVETIKKTVVRDELVGYLAVGIDKNGNTVQTCCGTSFMIEEMLADLFKELIKNNKKLGEAIFERLGTQLDKPKRNEPKDNSNDNEKSEEEVIKNIMDLLLKSLDIDPEGL